jgi:hypothetical protein
MTAAAYTTDLSLLDNAQTSTTGWSEPGTWTAGGTPAAETDYFIHGTGCISKTYNATGLGGLVFTAGAGVTIPTDGAFLCWTYFAAPNALDTDANGGIRLIIGSSTTAFNAWNLGGSTSYVYGGWQCLAADPAVTVDYTVGSPTATRLVFGWAANVANAVSKGNPFGIDVIRYGRCELRANGGTSPDPNATFAGAAAQNDSINNRWGLLQAIAGGYLWQGLLTLGYTSAIDFRDSNTQIVVANTKKVSANFNKIEIRQATSRVDWTSISFLALGTVSKGRLEVIDDADVNIESCSFTGMDTFVFKANSTVNKSTFRNCGQITANSAFLTNCTITGYEGTANTSALIWNTAVDPNGELDGTTFTKGTAATHAIEFGTTSPTSMTLTNVNFSGYNASNNQNDSAIHVKRTTGTVTINISGGSTPSYRTDGATVSIISGQVTVTISGLVSGSEVRIFRDSDNVELAGTDSSSTSFNYDYTYTSNTAIYIIIQKTNYKWRRVNATLVSTNQTIQANQLPDPDYVNP